ncbi:MAG: hypothetical protein HQ582_02910, partial [Planctomycetes bacterium]|nr:hypothetical protein [Planctomycetota bacterium]
LDGLGILPVPLKADPVGRLPEESFERLESFQLDFDGMVHDYFLLEGTSEEELKDLYALPYFFKAVRANLSDDVVERMVRSAAVRIHDDRARFAEARRRLADLAEKEVRESLSDAERGERERLEQARAEASPRWLLWQPPQPPTSGDALSPDELAEQSRPRVLASFTNQAPFMIQRRLGRGRVLFVSTGVFRDWNTLTATNAVLIFDRIFRHALEETLPRRNITSTGQLALPVTASERRARFTLGGADRREEPIGVDALGADRHGITVGNLTRRGHYRITAYATEETPQTAPGTKLWEIPLAVNGPADESDLTPLDPDELDARMAKTPYGWVDRGQTISLAGAPLRGKDLWRWLMLAVLAGLLVELAILVRPSRAGEPTA